ncbi:MAG TPA: VOC family protein [Acidimicrobiales bacterium]|nr:VOC family protein [Acidimicrobiales bacterium]
MLKPEGWYHTGIVVSEFDAALERLSAQAGYRFAEPLELEFPVRTAKGESAVTLRFTYSRPPGPQVEVIQEVPGTIYVPEPGSGLHHLGYWVDDVDAASAALEAAGAPLEAAGPSPDGTLMWAYHRPESGPRYELVRSDAKPMLEAWWNGEDLPDLPG